MLLNITDLERFPVEVWDEQPSKRWMELCGQMQRHQHQVPSVGDVNLERKWEWVSAYQKSVRRGLLDWTIRLLGGCQSISRSHPKEKAYFWRRICTTACEDVGYGDQELMNFVLASSTIFTPSKVTDQQLLSIWSFLTQEMCRTQKSRIYCQLSLIEEWLRNGKQPKDLDKWESELLLILTAPAMSNAKQRWAERNNWRGDGMVHFQHLELEVKRSEDQLRSFETISGLPDFTYDTHTRRGKRVLAYLAGCSPFRQFFTKHPLKQGRNEAMGWALFFTEGARIKDRLFNPQLDWLEEKFIAAQFEWLPEDWRQLMKLMEEAVVDGKVNDIRRMILTCESFD